MRLLYLLDHPHHPRQVSFRHGRAGGETQPIPEQRLGHRTADDFATLEHGLQVHRLPQGARLDVLILQRQADRLPVGAERLRIHGDAGEPARAEAPRRFGHQGDAGQAVS